MTSAQEIPWYEACFGREYLELYAHRNLDEARSDIRAIVDLLDPPRGEPLLDLACGAGRHLLVLRELGFDRLFGLDLSAELLEVALQTLDDDIALLRADMRSIPYRSFFSTVLSLFTSFGYFDQDDENQAVFNTVYNVLRPGGLFLIDYLNRDYVIANLVAQDARELDGRRVQNVRCLTDDCQRVEKTTTVVGEQGVECQFHESVRMYSAGEMRDMLRRAGFAGVRHYGSLSGTPFDAGSERLIMIARKPSQVAQG